MVGLALGAVFAVSGPARAATPASLGATPCLNPDPMRCVGPTTTTAPPTPPPSTPADPTTTVPAGTTTTTAPSGTAGPYGARLLPCGTPSGQSGACTLTPAQVAVVFPGGQAPPTVTMSWDRGTDPAAPQPATATVTLAPVNAVTCQGGPPGAGQAQICWAWPAAMTDRSSILNGTYHLSPDGQKALAVGLAVPPAPPRQVAATVATGSVKVSWSASASPEPDLVGYQLSRNGQAVYFCSVNGMGPGAQTPCPSPLSVTDHPGAGRWAYTVSSLRLGVDDASGDAVSSTPASAAPGPLTVAGKAAPTVVPAQAAALAPVGSVPPSSPSAGAGGSPAPPPTLAGGGQGVSGAAGSPVQNLRYPASRAAVAGSPSDLALKMGGAGAHPDVVPAAMLALAVIALAIAAHFVYLRVELGLAEDRMADRRRQDRQGRQGRRPVAG